MWISTSWQALIDRMRSADASHRVSATWTESKRYLGQIGGGTWMKSAPMGADRTAYLDEVRSYGRRLAPRPTPGIAFIGRIPHPRHSPWYQNRPRSVPDIA
eukprot:3611499-Rhodomonas_salina.1